MTPARTADTACGAGVTAVSHPERSLLVVDDDGSVRHALSITFRDRYDVRLAESGPDAVELFSKYPVDVALLDIHMPGMSGLQVLKQIKDIDPAVEVILLTGYETIEYVREAMRLGACEYITKPYIVEDLRASVDAAMARRQTSRKTAAYTQQLNQLQNEIHHQQMREELARTRNQIYASIIHDVTSPLTAIAGYCELMQHTVANAEMLEADQLAKVRKQAQLISRNVANCIDLSRRYLGFLEGSSSTKSQSSINEVFYDLAELLEAYPKVRAKQLIIQPMATNRQLAMHRTDLLQVLLNLTINALQSAVEYHRVEVAARELDPDGVHGYLQNGPGVHVLRSPQFNESVPLLAISIQDNGPGITEHLLSKIFEPYFTTKPPGQGSGLGLAIVQRLVLNAQGAIHLSSRPGEGSTFTICIPMESPNDAG